jgi:hypothetical protein
MTQAAVPGAGGLAQAIVTVPWDIVSGRNPRAATRGWTIRHYGASYQVGMEIPETVQCPFCGQSFELVIDTSIGAQRFTTDCEVCCRPFSVFVECEPGEILSLETQAE